MSHLSDSLLLREDVAGLLKASLRTLSNIQAGQFAGRPALKPILLGHRVTRFHPHDVEVCLRMSTQPKESRGRGRPRNYISK